MRRTYPAVLNIMKVASCTLTVIFCDFEFSSKHHRVRLLGCSLQCRHVKDTHVTSGTVTVGSRWPLCPLGSDETQYRNCVVWLEDQKIRHYKIEDRGNLRNVPSSDWPAAYQKVDPPPTHTPLLWISSSWLWLLTQSALLLRVCSTCRTWAVHSGLRRSRSRWTGYWAWRYAMNTETMVRSARACVYMYCEQCTRCNTTDDH